MNVFSGWWYIRYNKKKTIIYSQISEISISASWRVLVHFNWSLGWHFGQKFTDSQNKKDNLGKFSRWEERGPDWWLFIWSPILFVSCHRLIVIVWVRLGKCLIKTKTFLSMFGHKKCAQWILNMPNTACYGTTACSPGSYLCQAWSDRDNSRLSPLLTYLDQSSCISQWTSCFGTLYIQTSRQFALINLSGSPCLDNEWPADLIPQSVRKNSPSEYTIQVFK